MDFRTNLAVTRGELEDLVALSDQDARRSLVDQIIDRHAPKAPYIPPVDIIPVPMGSVWEEKTRPGHTVEVTNLQWTARIDRANFRNVTYKHLGVHNKRAQRNRTITSERKFLSRYRRVL